MWVSVCILLQLMQKKKQHRKYKCLLPFYCVPDTLLHVKFKVAEASVVIRAHMNHPWYIQNIQSHHKWTWINTKFNENKNIENFHAFHFDKFIRKIFLHFKFVMRLFKDTNYVKWVKILCNSKFVLFINHMKERWYLFSQFLKYHM